MKQPYRLQQDQRCYGMYQVLGVIRRFGLENGEIPFQVSSYLLRGHG